MPSFFIEIWGLWPMLDDWMLRGLDGWRLREDKEKLRTKSTYIETLMIFLCFLVDLR